MTGDHVHLLDPGRDRAAAILADRMLHPEHYRTAHVPERTCLGCGGGSRDVGSYTCHPAGATLSESCFVCYDSGDATSWKVWEYSIPWREVLLADASQQLVLAL